MLTPEERGPQAAWAYASRDRIGVSPEQVVALLGRYDPATIRKAETNDRHMSRPIWRALTELYPRLAHERGIPIPIPPITASGRGPAGDQAGLVAALESQAAAISELAAQVKRLADRSETELASALVELVRSGLLSGAPSESPAGSPPRP